ncbi:MAG: alpha-galactosidase [Clostridia bacterium]|nr:alpha-galactosidase [Clostridia bacterium]
MSIVYHEEQRAFYLHTPHTTYVLGVYDKDLVHVYWGPRLPEELPRPYGVGHLCQMKGSSMSVSSVGTLWRTLDNIRSEYPTFGAGDLREAAFHAEYADGARITELAYVGYTITAGKPGIPGLPATFAAEDEADTLTVELADEKVGLHVFLRYTAFRNVDAITRSVYVENRSAEVVNIRRIASASVDLADRKFEAVSLRGGWAKECTVQRVPLAFGHFSVDSKRGHSSSHMSPFLALVTPETTEAVGEVYAMSFIYSGNYAALASHDVTDTVRFQMGLGSFDFNWRLESGERFDAPEAAMVYSHDGLGGMSHAFHELWRHHLVRGRYAHTERPVLLNNWEATTFTFDEEKILSIAEGAQRLGVDLMVLDDGWFGTRNDPSSSLGDWYVNREKLPSGIDGLSMKIEKMGMRFGLWFEPEMISKNSDLYRAHPDWCIHNPGRDRLEWRQQLTLDLSRPEVCDAVLEMMFKVLDGSKISYVKWDMNRSMSNIGSAALPPERQQEVPHRYMLGLYRMMETLCQRYPNILWEGCSSGGQRFDAGMLYYMPQIWTSDDTDAIVRQSIHYGTSLVFPPETQGSHVSACPNHTTKRTVPMKTRCDVAVCWQFGFELDLNRESEADLATCRAAIDTHKRIRHTTQRGRMYRLASPFEGNYTAFQFVEQDGSRVVAFIGSTLAEPASPYTVIRFRGLDPEARYRDDIGDIYTGSFLMNVGLYETPAEDFMTRIVILERV